MPRAAPDFIENLTISVPPPTEQEAIADFLDCETAKIDELISGKERLIELLLLCTGTGLNRAIEDSSFEVLQLRRIVRRFVDYRGQTPEKTSSGVRLVTARNIKNGTVSFEESEEFIGEEAYKTWMVRGFPAVGDVLVTTEAPLGEVAVVSDPDIALAQRLILLKADTNRILSEYIWCYFRSAIGRAQLERRATGSTAVGIKASHLKSVPVMVPSLVEQERIVGAYKRSLADATAIISVVRIAIDRLHEYRAALITAAVTGQIDVHDGAGFDPRAPRQLTPRHN